MDFSWIFESIVNWVASIVTSIMDAISGIFLNALGTDMTAMEPFGGGRHTPGKGGMLF